MVESDPGDPTYKVTSKLTLEMNRTYDNSFITCAVDHATLTSGNKKSAQALRVLCESKGEREGEGDIAGANIREWTKRKTKCVMDCVYF